MPQMTITTTNIFTISDKFITVKRIILMIEFCHGRGCSRGHNYAGAKISPKKRLCANLVNIVFNYRHKSVADQMRKS